MKNNLKYDNQKPFTNLSNTDPIETVTIHYNKDKNKKNEALGTDKLVPLITGVSMLGVFSYHFAPDLLISAMLPLGGIATVASSLFFIKK